MPDYYVYKNDHEDLMKWSLEEQKATKAQLRFRRDSDERIRTALQGRVQCVVEHSAARLTLWHRLNDL